MSVFSCIKKTYRKRLQIPFVFYKLPLSWLQQLDYFVQTYFSLRQHVFHKQFGKGLPALVAWIHLVCQNLEQWGMEIVPNEIKMNMHCWQFITFFNAEIDIISYNILELPLFLKLGVLVDLLDSLFLHPPF